MDKEKQIEELENQLVSLQKSNRDSWMIYGSELCAGAMIKQEDELRTKIKALRDE